MVITSQKMAIEMQINGVSSLERVEIVNCTIRYGNDMN